MGGVDHLPSGVQPALGDKAAFILPNVIYLVFVFSSNLFGVQ